MNIGGCELYIGDCRESMREMKRNGVTAQMCVTSPPYFGLRDYGHDGQLGLEQTPEEYIAAMVEVFRCVWDVLSDDGTLWLNIGDSYASYRDGKATPDTTRGDSDGTLVPKGSARNRMASTFAGSSVKHKDLIGIPWMLAFALRADGWYLRQDIIWHKPNPMPESVTDRCTKSHEYMFLLTKSAKYYFDNDAIKEPVTADMARRAAAGHTRGQGKIDSSRNDGDTVRPTLISGETRNRRSVWSIATRPYKGAHFATFPPALIEPCILAGSRPDDTIIDPFGGSGTTAAVAIQHGRNAILCELNSEYTPLITERVNNTYVKLYEDALT